MTPPPHLDAHERLRATTAAGHARRRFGAMGQLVAREIEAYVRFGYRTDGTGLVPQVIDQLMRPEPSPPVATVIAPTQPIGAAVAEFRSAA